MSYFDDAEIVKKVTKGTMRYELVRDENGAGDVSFRLIRYDTKNCFGEFYRDEFRDENKAIYTFNKIVRGESTFLV
jgi:hypothetical protein